MKNAKSIILSGLSAGANFPGIPVTADAKDGAEQAGPSS